MNVDRLLRLCVYLESMPEEDFDLGKWNPRVFELELVGEDLFGLCPADAEYLFNPLYYPYERLYPLDVSSRIREVIHEYRKTTTPLPILIDECYRRANQDGQLGVRNRKMCDGLGCGNS